MKRNLRQSHIIFLFYFIQIMQEPEYSVPWPFVRHFDATVCKLFPDVDKKSFKVLDVAAGTGL